MISKLGALRNCSVFIFRPNETWLNWWKSFILVCGLVSTPRIRYWNSHLPSTPIFVHFVFFLSKLFDLGKFEGEYRGQRFRASTLVVFLVGFTELENSWEQTWLFSVPQCFMQLLSLEHLLSTQSFASFLIQNVRYQFLFIFQDFEVFRSIDPREYIYKLWNFGPKLTENLRKFSEVTTLSLPFSFKVILQFILELVLVLFLESKGP